MRSAAQGRAVSFDWEKISEILLEKIKFVAQSQGVLPPRNGNGHHPAKPIMDLSRFQWNECYDVDLETSVDFQKEKIDQQVLPVS